MPDHPWTLSIGPEEVRHLYWDEDKTVKAISLLVGKSENTVHRHMQLWGIPHKPRSQVNTQSWRGRGKPAIPPKEILEGLYLKREMSTSQIAALSGVSAYTVNSWLRRYGISVRSTAEGMKRRKLLGPLNPAWKGGRRIKDGYVLIRQPDHPRASKTGYVAEHILVWEKAHGRPLPAGWVIHHYDGNPANNRPSNLIAMTKSDHRKLHRFLLRQMQEMQARIEMMLEKMLLMEAEIELLRASQPSMISEVR